MKVAAFLGLVLASAVVLAGSVLLLLLVTPEPNPAWGAIAGGAVGIFLYAGILLGSLRAYWNVEASGESRAVYRRWLLVTLIVEAAAAVLLVAFALATGAPPWIPVLFIGLGAAITVAAPRTGAALRARETTVSTPDGSLMNHEPNLRRSALRMGITFAVTLVLSLSVLLGLSSALEIDPNPGIAVLFALSFAALAAAVVGGIAALSVSRRLRSIASNDLGLARRFSRAVFRGKPEAFDAAEQHAALDYARAALLSNKFLLGWLACLYVGLALQQVVGIIQRPDDALLSVVALSALGIACLIIGPVGAIQTRRAHQYVATHSDKIGDTTS